MKYLLSQIQRAFTPEIFKSLRLVRQNHTLEEAYSKVLNEVLDDNQIVYTRNLTSYPDYIFDDPDGTLLEVKATRSKSIKLNDTIPHKGVYYLVINLTLEKIILVLGNDLIDDDMRDKLKENKETLKSHRLRGRLSSYPRINLSLKLDWD